MTDRPPILNRLRPGRNAIPTRRSTITDVLTAHIRPPGRWPGWGAKEAWRYRSICVRLAQRTLKVRYRQTAVGVAWVLIQPLALMMIFSLFFGIFARLPTEGVPFPVFYLSGLVAWQAMSKVVSEGTNSVVGNAALVDRVYFPRVYFPTSVALANVVDLLVSLAALVFVMALYGTIPQITVVVAPLLFAIGYATSLGLAMMMSSLNVRFRDMAILVPLLVQLWFYITPVLYPASIVPPSIWWLYYLNPLALVVTGVRWAFVGTPPPPLVAWPLGIIVATVVLISGYLVFRYRDHGFADDV